MHLRSRVLTLDIRKGMFDSNCVGWGDTGVFFSLLMNSTMRCITSFWWRPVLFFLTRLLCHCVKKSTEDKQLERCLGTCCENLPILCFLYEHKL